jgi:carbon storage regulator
MLVLTRKLEQEIRIGADVTIKVIEIRGNSVRLGIEAPRTVKVLRKELTCETSKESPPSSSSGQAELIAPGRGPRSSARTCGDEGRPPALNAPRFPGGLVPVLAKVRCQR